MASAAPARFSTIGREAGRDYDVGVTFEETLQWTQPLKMSDRLPNPIVKNIAKGTVGESAIPDLPLEMATNGQLHQWVEVIHPFEEPVAVSALEKTLLDNKYQDLPVKLSTKTACRLPYRMQIFIGQP